MLPEEQKRILGYFIEEAKDHLNTIEQGVLNLDATIHDSEMVNEVFRAAHSVKGGAAMLGIGSMQRTAHRMEDFFKVMKESPLTPDQALESMLLKIFDGLQEQLDHLQSPYGLSDERGQAIIANLEPVFAQAEAHLTSLASGSAAAAKSDSTTETSALQLVFRSDIPALLRDMLAAFKQADNEGSRQQLAQLCQRLRRFGEQLDVPQWCNLVQTVEHAVGNRNETYRALAPVVIKDLKQAQDQVLAGQVGRVAASAALLALQPPAVENEADLDALLTDTLTETTDGEDLADLFATAEAEASLAMDAADDIDSEFADLFQTKLAPPTTADQADDDMASLFGDALDPSLGLDSEASTTELVPVPEAGTPAAQPPLDMDLFDHPAAAPFARQAIPDDMDEFFGLGVTTPQIIKPAAGDIDDFFAEVAVPATRRPIAAAPPKANVPTAPLPSPSAPRVRPAPTPSFSSPTPAPSTDEDSFDDLEKLLGQADQLGRFVPSTGVRRSGGVGSGRTPRRAAAATDQTMRVSVGHLDNLNNLMGELVVNRNSLEQDQEQLRQSLDNLLNQVQQLNDVGQRMRDLYEQSLLESSLMANRQAFALGNSHSRGGGGSGSHATGATFDALEMDRFTGFHTLSQEMIELIVRVREASSDIEMTIDSTDQITRQFRQVTTQLQEGLNKARRVPFGQMAERLPRAVRDISIKCGKEAKLVVEGQDTLIDKMILERLYDPMTHLVNNAITHGVEPPEERLAVGKSREGTVTVRAFYQGNQTVIYIADNGGGINPAVVKAKALQKELITPAKAQSMSDIEVYDLLFEPGFSTCDQADDFSGRGVGMDVVRTALTEIRGSITIESEVGKGTSFIIRLPLTLSITQALSCINNQARIAFPIDGVEDMFDVPKERVKTDDQDHSSILWRDTLLPVHPLSDLLKFNRSLGRGRVYGGSHDEKMTSIVVLRSASTFIGIQVDQMLGQQEIVIKQLEGPVPKPTGIAGATVLGDGRVMPIADVLELIDMATGRVRREAPSSLWAQPVDEEPLDDTTHTEPTVLIVDDSITVRERLSMSFNKVGYRVEQARDGQEAWEKLRSGLPCDLVFCDIEMPRMDGLELLSRLQKDETLSHLPIAMLTSRGADRHRQMAVDLGAKGYFTKPYLEEMLLDSAQRMLKGENMISLKEKEA
jgi:chemotaxis protein histidine kinase CheA/ActR/RegA family two-component response regulator